MLLAWLLGCLPTASGTVVSPEGPVAGAVIRAVSGPALDAVSDAAGHFEAEVESGPRTLRVTHPDHLPAEVDVVVEGRGRVELPPVAVVPVPVDPGVHLLVGGRFEVPALAPVVRTGSTTEGWRWCVARDGVKPVEVPAGTLRVLDNHAADWRVFRLDEAGCAYRLSPTAGGFFDQKADRVEVRRVEAFGPGRDWLELDLPAGQYLLADWFQGGFVPEKDGWRGSWVEAR